MWIKIKKVGIFVCINISNFMQIKSREEKRGNKRERCQLFMQFGKVQGILKSLLEMILLFANLE